MYLVEEKLRFYAFQHPYACRFVEALQRKGVGGLLTLSNQSWMRDNEYHDDVNLDLLKLLIFAPGTTIKKDSYFGFAYSPTDIVSERYPPYDVDFETSGAYAQYNWELFFHIPLLVAMRLMQDERHDEARDWFHYIFNPTTDANDAVPGRYWFFKPFRDLGKPEGIKQTLQKLQDPGTATAQHDEIEAAIDEWRDHPFEPHRIARRRPGAYQKTVVMKYIDNLIAWGDKLFRRDTIESINEATQLYVVAARILGRTPRRVPELTTTPAQTYADLRPGLDAFSNALVRIESVAKPFSPAPAKAGGNGAESLLGLGMLYFCIPQNDDLLRYWDAVADRLFKIRNCMNIEGVVRALPLFEPPIDPALLVRARALGLDLAAVLDDLSAPAPHYRFEFMLQKAREFCEELKPLGGLLLAALEKKDGEQLAQIRAGHEKALLDAVRDVKQQQIKEAENTLAGLEQARAQASLRQQFYSTRGFTITGEKEQLDLMALTTGLQTAGQELQLAASDAHVLPDQFAGGVAGTGGGAIHLTRYAGGSSAGPALASAGRALEILANVAQATGSAAGLLAGYRRRADDWKLQADLAAADVKQLDKQMAAAELRRQIAERDLANHELQIEQAAKIDDLLREKFTNQDLYGWMSSQVSAVYFQAYRLACDMAKRAERAYRLELGLEDSSFIQFGSWDSLRKGLLAGERLSLDLRRLEAAYLDQNRRTYELTKHVSLAQLDPYALVRLRETGACEASVPEVLFDLDYPGHYLRRIKSVSLTIPAVTGPYTSVSCTLTLLKHQVRRKATVNASDEALEDSFSPVQSIATSDGRNDAGVFDLNFRDERRLPFESAGAVSTWRIELPTKVRQFDYHTISDVILHFNYTALEGGAAFAAKRQETVTKRLNALTEGAEQAGLYRAMSLRHEFPNEWHRLREGQAVSLTVGRDRFPYFASVKKLKIDAVDWLAATASGAKPAAAVRPFGSETPTPIAWTPNESLGMFQGKMTEGAPAISLDQAFVLSSTSGEDLTALWLVLRYSVSD